MRVVLQRVTSARVDVDEKTIGEIADGFLLLLGVTQDDTQADADWMVDKVLKLRLFGDGGSQSFMEKSIVEHGGGILVVSQFTLYGNCRKGTRPSFTDAARPEHAESLYEYFVRKCIDAGVHTETGEFGEHMQVQLVNDGPVTLILDSKQ